MQVDVNLLFAQSKLCMSCAIGIGAAGLLSLGTELRWTQLLGSVGSLL